MVVNHWKYEGQSICRCCGLVQTYRSTRPRHKNRLITCTKCRRSGVDGDVTTLFWSPLLEIQCPNCRTQHLKFPDSSKLVDWQKNGLKPCRRCLNELRKEFRQPTDDKATTDLRVTAHMENLIDGIRRRTGGPSVDREPKIKDFEECLCPVQLFDSEVQAETNWEQKAWQAIAKSDRVHSALLGVELELPDGCVRRFAALVSPKQRRTTDGKGDILIDCIPDALLEDPAAGMDIITSGKAAAKMLGVRYVIWTETFAMQSAFNEGKLIKKNDKALNPLVKVAVPDDVRYFKPRIDNSQEARKRKKKT